MNLMPVLKSFKFLNIFKADEEAEAIHQTFKSRCIQRVLPIKGVGNLGLVVVFFGLPDVVDQLNILDF